MWSTEVAQCIIYSGKIYVQKISSTVPCKGDLQNHLCWRWAAMLYADQTFRFRHRCGPRSDLWGAFPLYWGKTSLYFMTFPPMRMSSIFLWPFCLWTKRTASTVLIGLPFCLWASAPLLLAGLNVCMRIFVVLSVLTVMYHRLWNLLGVRGVR